MICCFFASMAAIANGNPVPSSNQKCRIRRNAREKGIDLPPLRWSSLKYDFRMEDKINGKEE